jgi:hypothetical protein
MLRDSAHVSQIVVDGTGVGGVTIHLTRIPQRKPLTLTITIGHMAVEAITLISKIHTQIPTHPSMLHTHTAFTVQVPDLQTKVDTMDPLITYLQEAHQLTTRTLTDMEVVVTEVMAGMVDTVDMVIMRQVMIDMDIKASLEAATHSMVLPGGEEDAVDGNINTEWFEVVAAHIILTIFYHNIRSSKYCELNLFHPITVTVHSTKQADREK